VAMQGAYQSDDGDVERKLTGRLATILLLD